MMIRCASLLVDCYSEIITFGPLRHSFNIRCLPLNCAKAISDMEIEFVVLMRSQIELMGGTLNWVGLV